MGMIAEDPRTPTWAVGGEGVGGDTPRRSWLARIDGFVPPAIAALGGDTLRRGRLATAACLLGALTLLSSTVYTSIAGIDMGVIVENLVFGLLFLAMPLALRRSRSISLYANGAVCVGLCNLTVLWLGSAGTNVGALFAFPTVPLCGMLLSGRRAGITFTLLSIGAIFLPALFPAVPPGFAELRITSSEVATSLLRDAVLITVGVGGFSALYDVVRDAAVRDSDDARLRSEKSRLQAVASSQHLGVLVDVSRRLQARGPEFEEEIHQAVAAAAQIAGADASLFTLWDLRARRLLARYRFPEDGLFPVELPVSDVSNWIRRCRWARRFLEQGQVIAVPRIDALPPEAEAERELFSTYHVGAWLTVPIRGRQPGATGFLTVACREQRQAWSEEDVRYIRLLSEVITSALNQSRAEAALRESEEKFSRAFAGLPDGLVLVDAQDMRILECNDAFVALAHAPSRQDVIGAPLADLALEFVSGDCSRLMDLLQHPGSGRAVEVTARGGTSLARQLEVVTTPIEVDRRACTLVVVRDVTEQRHLEVQLRQSQKMEAVGRLAGGVAHDFNNMLTVITGWAESLREELRGSQRDAIDQIRTSAQRSADLTRRLLAFSRQQILQPRGIDLNDLLRGAESLLRRLIGEHIHLVLDLADEAVGIRVDPVRLEQAVVNLAINARDAMPQGGVLYLRTRTVQLERSTAQSRGLSGAGDFARLQVIDDGCGMDDEMMARVLEPFFTTKQEGEGTGLGLSMADAVVRQSGGALELKSVPGTGTTVDIYLPLVSLASEADARETRETAPRSAEPRTVLLAEDEDLVRRLARRVLENAGHRVLEATNGAEALSVASAHDGPIHLLLSDLVMPRMGGIELAKRLREVRPALRVVFMSGYPRDEGGEALPADVEILAKPFTPTELRERLEQEISA